MKYLIVQEWENTEGNHAGMKHMCDMLVSAYADQYKMIAIPPPSQFKISNNAKICKLLEKIHIFKPNVLFKRHYYHIAKSLSKILRQEDEIFLLEYLVPHVPQNILANYIRQHVPMLKIYAMAHLTPSWYKSYCDDYENFIKNSVRDIDVLLTLGSSASSFFSSFEIKSLKIDTGKHYVDSSYYGRTNSAHKSDKPVVISMGNMQRNYSILADIIKQCHDVDFIICHGKRKLDPEFQKYDNVRAVGFVPEDILRGLMQDSDISLNIMDDTVGSNVITTSMSMGLAIIASDVGSIRDYCTNNNCIFCENTVESFVSAIHAMSKMQDTVLDKMKESSIEISKQLSIEYVHSWFSGLDRL